MMCIKKEHRFFAGLMTLYGVFIFLFWMFLYANHMIHREQTQLFLRSSEYWRNMWLQHGGFSLWLGGFVTQFLGHSLPGALVITLLLLMLAGSVRKLLRLYNTSLLSDILSMLPAVVYGWLLTDPYYLLAGVIAVTVVLQAFTRLLKIRDPKHAFIIGMLLLPAVYWLAGGAFLIYGTLWIITLISGQPWKRGSLQPVHRYAGVGIVILLMVAIPLLFRKQFFLDTILQSYLSEVFYKIRVVVPPLLAIALLTIPLVVLMAISGTFGFSLKGKTRGIYAALVPAVLGVAMAGTWWFYNPAEENELRYDHWVYHEKWDEIIARSEKEFPEGPVHKLALSMALAQQGKLTDRMFGFGLRKENLFMAYNLEGFAPLVASEPFYRLGLVNFARMMAMESIESSPDALMPVRAVERVAQTDLINRQYGVAERYLRLLEKTTFYRKEARRSLQALHNEEVINSYPEWGRLRALQPKTDFYYRTGDYKISLLWLLNGNLDNKMAYEYLMAIFLFELDFDSFLKNLAYYPRYKYTQTPLAFQEAVAYIGTLTDELPPEAANIEVSEEVRARLNEYAFRYMNGGERQPGKMKSDYGKTFWYYLHFEAKE